jgi:hypothetical protein
LQRKSKSLKCDKSRGPKQRRRPNFPASPRYRKTTSKVSLTQPISCVPSCAWLGFLVTISLPNCHGSALLPSARLFFQTQLHGRMSMSVPGTGPHDQTHNVQFCTIMRGHAFLTHHLQPLEGLAQHPGQRQSLELQGKRSGNDPGDSYSGERQHPRRAFLSS